METATQKLHRLTSYEPGREWDEPQDDPSLVQDLVANDLDRLPWFYKRFPTDLPRVALPRDLPPTDAPALAVLSGAAEVQERPLDLPHLARLLFLSSGVVRTMERPYGAFLFRAAGSAGGRFPLELYACIPEGSDIPAGVHWYDPHEHALVTIGPPPQGEAPAVVVTGIPWRTGWRYRERGYRHIYWDAGTMLSQLLIAAQSAGISADLFTAFPDDELAGTVGADQVHEWPVALVRLGEGTPAVKPGGAARQGAVDGAPLEFPLVTEAQRAGRKDAFGAPWPVGPVADVPVAAGRPVEDVILARGSQRRFDPTASAPASALTTSLAVALRGTEIPHFVAVHGVEAVDSGIYRWPDLDDPLRTGDLRAELFRVCLDQSLGRDAAYVVIGAADVSALDDHAYRDVQLGAGLVEGRLHLAAYALGLGASGMTFLDSEIPGLVGVDLDGLLFTCVGVPAYATARGGGPGAAVEVRRVDPAE